METIADLSEQWIWNILNKVEPKKNQERYPLENTFVTENATFSSISHVDFEQVNVC